MDILDLPEPLLHRLIVVPRRLRSAAAARRAIEDAANTPESVELRRFVAAIGGPSIGVDDSIGREGRVALLAVLRTAYSQVAPQLVAEASKLGFTVYDVESGTILSKWSAPTTGSAADTIRDVIYHTKGTSLGLGQAVELGLGAANALSLLPRPVGIGLDLPRDLAFMLPVEVSPHKQTGAARRRYVAELRSDSSRVRRMAAFDLGGWGPDPQLDELLAHLRRSDPDPYVRAAASISCVARRIGSPSEYWQGLESVSDTESVRVNPFRDVTIAMMLVAALASSSLALDPIPCDAARHALTMIGAEWLPGLRLLVDRCCR